MKLKVLKNGPTKDSQDELDCAAWLINNNLANGNVLPDFTRTGNHVASVVWQCSTPAGEKYLRNSKLIKLFLNPYVVAAITGICALLVSYFSDRILTEPMQHKTQPYVQQKQ